MRFFRTLPPTPAEYRNDKALADLLLGEDAIGYLGGAGSCAGCGEATAIRDVVAATRQVHGPESMGIVAATGCNTVYGSTYPFNPYLVPWTNSLFENAPAVASGIRARWDQAGIPDRQLWVIGGDGAMFDIGFQALSRMVASGADIKVLVLDTQVYSNTGGQASTASYGGQVTKLSAFGEALHGRTEPRKELGRILMAHGEAYVAQTTPAHLNHFYRADHGGQRLPGSRRGHRLHALQPEHGIADDASSRQSKLAVESRTFPLFTYDPRRGPTIAERLSLQGNPALAADWATAPDGYTDRLPGVRQDRGTVRAAFRPGRNADRRDRRDTGRSARRLAEPPGMAGLAEDRSEASRMCLSFPGLVVARRRSGRDHRDRRPSPARLDPARCRISPSANGSSSRPGPSSIGSSPTKRIHPASGRDRSRQKGGPS